MLLVVVLGRRVPAPLLGEHVDQDRPVGRQLDRVVERVLHLLDVVPVERSDVAETEILEEHAAQQAGLQGVLRRKPDFFIHHAVELIVGYAAAFADVGPGQGIEVIDYGLKLFNVTLGHALP